MFRFCGLRFLDKILFPFLKDFISRFTFFSFLSYPPLYYWMSTNRIIFFLLPIVKKLNNRKDKTLSGGEKATLRGFLGSIPAWIVCNKNVNILNFLMCGNNILLLVATTRLRSEVFGLARGGFLSPKGGGGGQS